MRIFLKLVRCRNILPWTKLRHFVKICTDAERVAKSRDLTLNDAKLCIRLLHPSRLPTFVTADDNRYLKNAFLFIDLPQRLDADKLEQYAEKAAGLAVDRIIFSCINPSAALVVYRTDPGMDAIFLPPLLLLLLLVLFNWSACPELLHIILSSTKIIFWNFMQQEPS